ncbi:peptidase domain-containing ABC transporter [Sinorhizobium sp. NFACC03]|uniref:peptidase domain-containing ABC transporter n=1 Tax=Sinorhizobium sp. NFACC03 TaxID=1566295 RepID=UPI000888E96E|nr:peptidase domain-containing ABC transporter [Sinorhizobium sp. NFACC03]SDA93675.1 colicin V processing peptidase. Cysteine peptidase. MEROPS family C39 [Sinorhizobium sp. NFACC03]
MRPVDFRKVLPTRAGAATPIILQSETAECGLACLATIASHYGRRMDVAAVRQHFSVSLKGNTLKDLVHAGARLNLATRALRLDLGNLQQLRLPCILHWDHNHFVVLTQVGRGTITVHDPAIGRRKYTFHEVSEHFTGVALECWPTASFEKKKDRPRLKLGSLLRQTPGIGRIALQLLAISLLLEVATVSVPAGFQLILDEVVVAGDQDLLTVIILALCILLAMQVAARLVRAWATVSIGSRLILQWKVALFDRLMELPLAFFEKRHVGDVVSRFGSLDALQRTLTANVVQAFLDGLMSMALVLLMWAYGGGLLAVALASAALYVAMRVVFHASYRSISEEVIVHTARENSHFMESARGMASVKALNLSERRRVTWVNHLVDRVNAELRVQRFDATFTALRSALVGIDRILIVYLGANAILHGSLSVGMLVAFLAYKDQFAIRVEGFIDACAQFAMLRLHAERVAEIALESPEERRAIINMTDRDDKPGSLEFKEVQFRYGDNETNVLSGLDLVIGAGECVAISGPSGSGKSTILKLMAGLIQPTSGQILFDGASLNSIGVANYRNHIGCVLQEDRLFAGSIADNICAFDPAADRNWIKHCARSAAIHDEILLMPMGYETRVGDMGCSLSGGQRQRIILARALYRRPAILLLDEATSHLDETNEAAINGAVRTLPMTRIIVAHRPSTLKMADRIIRLDRPTRPAAECILPAAESSGALTADEGADRHATEKTQ